MKRTSLIVLCALMTLLLCCCKSEEQDDNMQIANNKTVTFINLINGADVWILPQTEENLKTTVWGTPTISKAKAGESFNAVVEDAGDIGVYMLRMIDTDGFFYSADGLILESGWTIEIKGNDTDLITAEVKDENGVLTGNYDIFSARL